jgi:TPR repeat protein
LIGFSMCSALLKDRSSSRNNASQSDVINRPAASPVTDPGQQAREAAILAEQTAAAQKKKADADEATFKFNHDRALSGNLESMYRLAQLYIEGIGCDRDTNAAIGWLRAAASVGHPEASALLSRLQGDTNAPSPH